MLNIPRVLFIIVFILPFEHAYDLEEMDIIAQLSLKCI
jgi:hypothetical protein